MEIEQWDEYMDVNNAIYRIINDIDMNSPMRTMVEHICSSGGKKIRSVILLLCTDICYCNSNDDNSTAQDLNDLGDINKNGVNAAAAIELIHSASLIHDDILDEGVTRRGVESAHHKFGPASALLAGDYLISRSIELISPYEHDVIREFGTAGMAMAEGEALDIALDQDSLQEEEYFECIRKKTASLFSASAAMGAYIAGADQNCIDHLRAYGDHLGTAYQILDDLLEFTTVIPDKKSRYESLSLLQIYDRTLETEKAINIAKTTALDHIQLARDNLETFSPCRAREKLLHITELITAKMLPDGL